MPSVNDGDMKMNKRQRKWLAAMLLTISASGILATMGTFLNNIPLFIFSVLLLLSLPLIAHHIVKNNSK